MVKLEWPNDRYSPDCGVVSEGEIVCCGICGDKMDEYRGSTGPRSWIQSIGSAGKEFPPHDVFTCPNYSEDWHKQVKDLDEEIKSTSSLVIANMLRSELDEILKSRVATKKKGYRLLP